MHRILILPGDGIGPEVTGQALRVLEAVAKRFGLALGFESGLIGGAAIDAQGTPLADETLALAKRCRAVLLGAVGGPKWDAMPVDKRPERGLLRIRKELGLFANLRPARVFPALAQASTLRPEVVEGIDLLVVRELTGGLYFGEPRGRALVSGRREARNTLVYDEVEIERIARVAFEAARGRRRHLTHVHKANVLEVSQLWVEVVNEVAKRYDDVELAHQLVDSCAMLLVREPRRFDVLLTENLFGDILSDEAAMITGSLGMLPSASLGEGGVGLYEPVHGSAPDIAGQDVANPLAAILSVAMLLEHSLGHAQAAAAVRDAVNAVLAAGHRSADLLLEGRDAARARLPRDGRPRGRAHRRRPMTAPLLRVAVVGATGAMGGELLDQLRERRFPLQELRPIATERSLGETVDWLGHELPVATDEESLRGLDLAFVCTPPAAALEWIRRALQAGVACVDFSGALSSRAEVPLLCAEREPDREALAAPLLAAPAPAALALARVLAPIGESAGLARVSATLCEAASGAGRAGVDALQAETIALFNQEDLPESELGRAIAFDCLPASGPLDAAGASELEARVSRELGRLLGEGLPRAITVLRIPTFAGMGIQRRARDRARARAGGVPRAARQGGGCDAPPPSTQGLPRAKRSARRRCWSAACGATRALRVASCSGSRSTRRSRTNAAHRRSRSLREPRALTRRLPPSRLSRWSRDAHLPPHARVRRHRLRGLADAGRGPAHRAGRARRGARGAAPPVPCAWSAPGAPMRACTREGQVAAATLETRLEPATLGRALNAKLPGDVAVVACALARDGFDPRREATGKLYRYAVWNAPRASPLRRRRFASRGAASRRRSDARKPRRALVGRHDFASFQAAGSSGRGDGPHARARRGRGRPGRRGPLRARRRRLPAPHGAKRGRHAARGRPRASRPRLDVFAPGRPRPQPSRSHRAGLRPDSGSG